MTRCEVCGDPARYPVDDTDRARCAEDLDAFVPDHRQGAGD